MDNSQMQNLNTQQSETVTTQFNTDLNSHVKSQMSPFSSTKLGLKQRYMLDFLKDLKKADVKKESHEIVADDLSQKEVLFLEIKGLLADF